MWHSEKFVCVSLFVCTCLKQVLFWPVLCLMWCWLEGYNRNLLLYSQTRVCLKFGLFYWLPLRVYIYPWWQVGMCARWVVWNSTRHTHTHTDRKRERVGGTGLFTSSCLFPHLTTSSFSSVASFSYVRTLALPRPCHAFVFLTSALPYFHTVFYPFPVRKV